MAQPQCVADGCSLYEPTLYITSRRDIARTNAVTDIKIYSNAREAELFVNETSQGVRTNDGNAVFVWKDLQLKSGKNAVEARAQRSGVALKDNCEWQLAP